MSCVSPKMCIFPTLSLDRQLISPIDTVYKDSLNVLWKYENDVEFPAIIIAIFYGQYAALIQPWLTAMHLNSWK